VFLLQWFSFYRKLVTALALIVTAIGIGGIKPSVAAFGGDQFVFPEQEALLTVYFSIYYFSINMGATLSTIFTPMLRADVSCMGEDTCYSLAFGTLLTN
jgi:solute carrier family 15 oligopeptide transporter 1